MSGLNKRCIINWVVFNSIPPFPPPVFVVVFEGFFFCDYYYLFKTFIPFIIKRSVCILECRRPRMLSSLENTATLGDVGPYLPAENYNCLSKWSVTLCPNGQPVAPPLSHYMRTDLISIQQLFLGVILSSLCITHIWTHSLHNQGCLFQWELKEKF